jgi:vacuolar-type H+-ATPase subunit F/Vma7
VGSVVVLGERSRVTGFALAGACVAPADDARTVLAAWAALEHDVAVVVLTPAAAAALGAMLDEPPRPDRPLTVVMPGTGGSGPSSSAAEAPG